MPASQPLRMARPPKVTLWREALNLLQEAARMPTPQGADALAMLETILVEHKQARMANRR